MAHPSAVAPFAPPPRFYEDFEPHSNTEFKCPAPPPPLEGPYVMFGKQYDTSFSPQDPSIAHRQFGLDLEFENQSPVATLRLLNRLLPDEYLKLMQVGRAILYSLPQGCSPAASKTRVCVPVLHMADDDRAACSITRRERPEKNHGSGPAARARREHNCGNAPDSLALPPVPSTTSAYHGTP